MPLTENKPVKQLEVKMKRGQIIKIQYGGENYEVKVLKILEMFKNGNGFVRVKFPLGYIRDISIKKGNSDEKDNNLN